jgi:hypothetical protein
LAVADPDLILEIRENYINVYCKGNSPLKLTETARARYKIAVHPKFTAGLDVPAELVDLETTVRFLACVPRLKSKPRPACGLRPRQPIGGLRLQAGRTRPGISVRGQNIRANNFEPRNVSKYFIVDRKCLARRITCSERLYP